MNSPRTTFLMTFLTVNLVAAGRALDEEAGALIAFAFTSVLHGIGFWFGDKIVLRLRGARAICPDEAPHLYRIAQELTVQAQVPMVKFYLLPQKTPSALVRGRDAKDLALVLTEDVLNLDEAKLRRVVARKLLQIKNGDKLIGPIAASVAGAFSVLANIGK